MLRGLRKVSSNWIGKAIMATVMGILIFSFGIWGIADIFRGFGRSTLVRIGSTEIGVEQFRQIYNDRLQQVGRQFGRPLTPDQARAFGLDRQILQQTIAETTLDETARKMGLAQSDAAVIQSISNDPNFAGINGKFDPARFAAIIRNFGFTEARYIAEQRRTMLRRELATTISSGIEPPQVLLDIKNRYDNETRSVDYLRLTEAQAGTIDQPSPEQLASYFDDHKTQFKAPEFRKLALIVLDPQDQAKWANVSDEDAKKVFEASKEKFGKAERRQVEQIVFPNADDARAARERLNGGMSFEDLAKERGLNSSDYDLGVVTKSGILDPAVADAAFALPENQVSEPIQGRFGSVLVKVGKIEPGVVPNYEAVAGVIKSQLAADRARSAVQDLHNKVEDERGGGASVTEAAQKAGVAPVTIDAVDRSGRDPSGAPVAALAQNSDVIAAAFASDVGSDNDPIRTKSGGYIWFDVLGITPSRDRSIDEVRDQVAARWRSDQIGSRLKAKADELLDLVTKGGKTLAEAAGTVGIKVETQAAFKRSANVANLGSNVVDGAFRLTKGQSERTTGDQPNEWIVYTLTDVSTPAFDPASADAKTLREDIQRQQSEEQVAQYIAKRESEIGVKVNEQAFAIVTGAAAPDSDN